MSTDRIKENKRIAFASSDGKVINRHFGRADLFIIIDISSDDGYNFVENRTVQPLCDNGEHSDANLLTSIEALGDCTAVIAAKIGVSAKRMLEINGISVFEETDLIENAIKKLAKYYFKNI